jgi:hypothetical protein
VQWKPQHLAYYLDEFTFRFKSPKLQESRQAVLSPHAAGRSHRTDHLRSHGGTKTVNEADTTCRGYLSQVDSPLSLYPVQQITRANASTGRLRRQGLRPQPARPPRPRRDTAGSRAATRAATANHRRSHPPSGHPVSVATRRGKVTPGIGSGCPRPLPQRINTSDARGDQTRTSAWIPATTARRVRVEFGFPSGGCAHLDRSQPEARQPALRRTQDTCDHLGRNLECLCYFQSRMGSLAAQPEVQADHFFTVLRTNCSRSLCTPPHCQYWYLFLPESSPG